MVMSIPSLHQSFKDFVVAKLAPADTWELYCERAPGGFVVVGSDIAAYLRTRIGPDIHVGVSTQQQDTGPVLHLEVTGHTIGDAGLPVYHGIGGNIDILTMNQQWTDQTGAGLGVGVDVMIDGFVNAFIAGVNPLHPQ